MPRIPYLDLTAEQKTAIHTWLDDHGVDHRHVPLDTQFTYDDQQGTWTVDIFKTDAEGRHYLDGNREIARDTVTFRAIRDVPWPKATGGRVTGIPYVVGEHGCVCQPPTQS